LIRPATVHALVVATMLSTPSQAQVEETRYVRTGLVSLIGGYWPGGSGLTISRFGEAAYRLANPADKAPRGGKVDTDRWRQYSFSEACQESTELAKGYTLEIVPEGQPSFRVRVEDHGMWRPGQISWLCWVPERSKIMSVRLFKDGAFLGETHPKDVGFVPEIDIRYDAGKLSWKATVKAEVMQIVGSDDGGKTWRIYGHGQEKSVPVNLNNAPSWIFAIECVNQDDGKFFRKEIHVKR